MGISTAGLPDLETGLGRQCPLELFVLPKRSQAEVRDMDEKLVFLIFRNQYLKDPIRKKGSKGPFNSKKYSTHSLYKEQK